MKNRLKFLLVLFPVMAIGQTTTQNYIKTTTYKQPFAEANLPTVPTTAQASQNVTYFDGLGRPIQQVASQQSSSGKDIITHIEYDSFGRQTQEYLPFKSESSSMAFDPAAKANTTSYYGSPNPALNGNPALEATSYPFSQKELEASPLNRILKQAAPGNDWRSGSGHEIKMDYQTNTAGEVKLFRANTVWDAAAGLYTISFVNSGNYAANELYKTITYDENTAATPLEINGSTVEFKNKEGQVVLKRTYDAQVRHDTYYIYDIYGNLTYVIPPKAVDLIENLSAVQANVTSTVQTASGNTLNLVASNSITLLPGFHAQAGSTFSAVIDNGTQGILDQLCYQYKYDYRNRLVEKKLPGKQWEFIVYDKLDRPVATGPANSPFSDITSAGWVITKYDAFSRPVYTGWSNQASTSTARKTLQDAQNAATVLYESKQSSGTIDGIAVYYSNTIAPTSFKLLTVNYYDNYSFPDAPVIPTALDDITDQEVYYNTSIKPIGLETGTWARVPETSTTTRNEQTYTLYDAKARPVKSYIKNFLGGYTYTESKLDPFSGRLEHNVTTHKRLFEDSEELKTSEIYYYSDQDRLLTLAHFIYGRQVPEPIQNNTYDELGQLISKEVGGVQKIDYTYNTRGWLTGINDVNNLQKGINPKDLFAFKINYNLPSAVTGVSGLYNGNISETQWATNSDNGTLRAYGYKYDKLNRLKESISAKNGAVNNAYNENLWYDKNGNITGLNRNGNSETAQLIDNLVYNYSNDNKSNQLVRVTDSSLKNLGFTEGSNTGDDYSYDLNGNMISDTNKNITAITYNHLNLPTKVTFATTGNIVYIYNAAGQKLQKIVSETGKTAITTDYLGGYQYDNSVLKFFPTAEGYVEPSGSSFKYIFQYKDHLGNVRLSYDQTLAIKEENNYYPFGLKQEGYNNVKTGVENKFKYNSKELQDELGLNMYDYGARNYDPAIGRWMNIDPLAEKSRRFNPYTYALDNPVFFIDPDGMEAKDPNDIITKVSNTRGDKHYKQRDVNMTMTLTIVNINGLNLSKTMFNKSSGNVSLSSLSGNAQSDDRNTDKTTSDNLTVSVAYKVVNSLADVGKDEHVMILADNIPKMKDGTDPVGLAEKGGRVSAVEKGTIANNTFNEAATHEIGHLLGLSHKNGGLMNPTINGSLSTNQKERGEIINGGAGQISQSTGNGTYRQSSVNTSYKSGIKSQVNSFVSSNNITW
ncbi:DUF6443 domain-containing protein [Flavobacterium tructae]|uniref:DUF6443 domain-containing protein n=1 Tax=Flavobacterium tructae TaxID=1114873 RepID=UPI002551E14D|nr:DUF6443 domain-containing protein [Flavobacterium tructae]MDL2144388.1 DUF6443 domain-containing protein [Flavobacterium tructae]